MKECDAGGKGLNSRDQPWCVTRGTPLGLKNSTTLSTILDATLPCPAIRSPSKCHASSILALSLALTRRYVQIRVILPPPAHGVSQWAPAGCRLQTPGAPAGQGWTPPRAPTLHWSALPHCLGVKSCRPTRATAGAKEERSRPGERRRKVRGLNR